MVAAVGLASSGIVKTPHERGSHHPYGKGCKVRMAMQGEKMGVTDENA